VRVIKRGGLYNVSQNTSLLLTRIIKFWLKQWWTKVILLVFNGMLQLLVRFVKKDSSFNYANRATFNHLDGETTSLLWAFCFPCHCYLVTCQLLCVFAYFHFGSCNESGMIPRSAYCFTKRPFIWTLFFIKHNFCTVKISKSATIGQSTNQVSTYRTKRSKGWFFPYKYDSRRQLGKA